MTLKYNAHVQLAPTLHEGQMKHYWNITMTTSDGTFTVAHGYEKRLYSAFFDAEFKAKQIINNLR